MSRWGAETEGEHVCDQWQESKVDRAVQAMQEEEQAHSRDWAQAMSLGQFKQDIGDLASPQVKGHLLS